MSTDTPRNILAKPSILPSIEEQEKAQGFERDGKKWTAKLTKEDKQALHDLGELGFSPD